MHTPEEPTRQRDVIQQAQSIADAAANSEGEYFAVAAIRICDVDLPIIIAHGDVYVQATLQLVFDALSASMVEFLRHLEDGISDAGRGALASAGVLPKVYFPRMVESDVVRDSGEPR